ncbi:hypothetical protein BDR26DRAFT_852293 [Obelidium mucronatum]|nr:hypothetical protein BDR26DRAFT_852293 [Obelidium mucronatum]
MHQFTTFASAAAVFCLSSVLAAPLRLLDEEAVGSLNLETVDIYKHQPRDISLNVLAANQATAVGQSSIALSSGLLAASIASVALVVSVGAAVWLKTAKSPKQVEAIFVPPPLQLLSSENEVCVFGDVVESLYRDVVVIA